MWCKTWSPVRADYYRIELMRKLIHSNTWDYQTGIVANGNTEVSWQRYLEVFYPVLQHFLGSHDLHKLVYVDMLYDSAIIIERNHEKTTG